MVDVSSQNSSISINVSSSGNSASINATPDMAMFYSEKSREWAISNRIVDGVDYSSKYYAQQSGANAQKVVESENKVKEIYNALLEESSGVSDEIREAGNEALTNIETVKNEAVDSINSSKTTIINDIEFVADGEKKEIEDLADLIKENAEEIASRISFAMFDTILKDHVLTYEESKGLALQGTWVYKEAIAGSRYGYPDFYNKCLEEFNEVKEEKWKQPVLTGETTQVAEGEIVCTASSYYTTENRQPYCAMDGVKSGTPATLAEFTLGNVKTGWWQVKFPYKLKITGLKYYAPYSTSGASYIATTGRFYTSSDKSTPIGDELSTTDNWQEVDIANIPPEGVITDTIYFDITNSGNYGGIGELEITATKAGVVKHPNGHLFYDIADKDIIDSIFESTGSAWFYGIDAENERIFLPRNNYFEQMTGDVLEVGNSVEAGLPNITGGFWRTALAYGADGCFTATSAGGQGFGSHMYDTASITLDASKSNAIYGNSDTVQPNAVKKLLYICVGNTVAQSTVTDVVDVTTTENDTTPLFTGLYFDFTPNNVSWVKAGRTVDGDDIYAFVYNELVNILNGETKYGELKVIDEADMIAGIDYSLYWKVNQDNMTFTTPSAISNKALSGAVVGNGMTLGLTDGTNTYGSTVSTNFGYTLKPTGDAGSLVGSKYTATGTLSTSNYVGLATDSTKSGIIAEQSTSQLYFKVANAVQNLELLDVGTVMEKAVLRSSLVEAQVVIETYQNGSSGYRIWSDGYCEQWGAFNTGSSYTTATFTFLKPFINMTYNIILTSAYNGNAYVPVVSNKTMTTFTAVNLINLSNYGTWQANGYIK